MKKAFKRFNYLIAVALVSFTALSSILPQTSSTAYAAIAADPGTATGTFYTMTVAEQATVWSTYSALKSGECYLKEGVSEADIKSGKWLAGDKARVGLHIDAGDGRLGCNNENNWFSNLLNLAGYTGDYTQPADLIFNKVAGSYFPKNDGTAQTTMLNLIGSKLFQGNIPNIAPDQTMYYIMYKNVVADKGCNASLLPANVNDQPANKFPIHVYDIKTDTVSLTTYGYTADKTDAPVVGFGVDSGNDAKLECQSIAKRLGDAKYANEFKAYVAANPGSSAEKTDSTSGAAGAADPSLDCDFKKRNPLTWLLCPTIQGMNAVIVTLDEGIVSLLSVDQEKIFSTEDGKGYYGAWQTFRGIALAILVIAALAMVIAQALGFEVLDAYTIKKILPRLIFAIVGIALSWEIMKFFVILTNDLGVGIRQIIYLPFKNLDNSIQLDVAGQLIMNIIGGGAIAALGIVGLLSFVVTAAMAVAIAFLVLIVRQLIIIVLILFAPIAIACSILPNTQSVYKLWYESFTKALMMFPIIVAFLAVGKVFAVVAVGSDIGKADAISQLMAFAAYIMPYFLIPLTFKFAGGLMRTIGGSFNDRSRGGFDRLRKYRGNTMATRKQKASSGELYNNKTMNTLTARGSTRNLGFGRRGREAYDQKMAVSAGAFAKSEKAQGIMFKDDSLRAMTYGSAFEARNRMARDYGMNSEDVEQSIAGVKASGGFGKARQVYAAKQLAATGTGYDDDTQMYSTIARVSGGNKVLADSMWGEMRGTSERAGRNDLKTSYGMGSALLSDIIDSGNARASSNQIGIQYRERFEDMAVEAARGTDGMSLARNKPSSIRNMMGRMNGAQARHASVLEQAAADPTSVPTTQRYQSEVTLGQIRAKMENMESNTAYGPEVNTEAIYGTRQGLGVQNGRVVENRRPGTATFGGAVADAHEQTLYGQRPYQEESLQRNRQGVDPLAVARDRQNRDQDH
ncbi:MAG TPA: hypothetical protein VF575_04880 [Candidatus Saccharimonadales bacterium]|jgi:hypothetical protein